MNLYIYVYIRRWVRIRWRQRRWNDRGPKKSVRQRLLFIISGTRITGWMVPGGGDARAKKKGGRNAGRNRKSTTLLSQQEEEEDDDYDYEEEEEEEEARWKKERSETIRPVTRGNSDILIMGATKREGRRIRDTDGKRKKEREIK